MDVRGPVKTPVAAQHLGVAYTHLVALLRHGKIARPQRDSSGHYLWSEADLAAARAAVPIDRRRREHRDRRPVWAGEPG